MNVAPTFNQQIEFLPTLDGRRTEAWWHVVALAQAAYGEAWISADFADAQPLLATLRSRADALRALERFLDDHGEGAA